MILLKKAHFWCVRLGSAILLSSIFVVSATAQHAELRIVPRRDLPTRIDGNTPSFWREGELTLFSSVGTPLMISRAPNQFGPWKSEIVE
jgi:hypothetical protein